MNRRKVGSAEPLVGLLTSSFFQLISMWALGYIFGGCKKLSRFWSPVGPQIHVKSMCRPLIH
jgi:hypothetical protein